MALDRTKIINKINPNGTTYDIVPTMLTDTSHSFKASMPTLSADATIALTSDLSNRVKFDDTMMETNPFGGQKLYINTLYNAFANADKKYYVTITKHKRSDNSVTYPYEDTTKTKEDDNYYVDGPVVATLTTSAHNLFNGSYEDSINLDSDGSTYLKIRIMFGSNTSPSASDSCFLGYPYGYWYISYYYNNTPNTAAQVRVYNKYPAHTIGWHLYNASWWKGSASGTNVIQLVSDTMDYQRTCVDFIIYGNNTSGRTVNVTQIDYKLQRPNLARDGSTLTKFGPMDLYENFTWYKEHLKTLQIDSTGVITGYGTDGTTSNLIITPSSGNISAKSFTENGTSLSDKYQAKDADLTAIAGLSGTSGFLKKTAANTWELDTTKPGQWDAKYDKPSTGIPSTDLAQGVQDSLGLADSALQSHQSIKTLKTDNTTTQTTSSSETINGSGTINLHKISKTGDYNDLLNKPTIPTVNYPVTDVEVDGSSVLDGTVAKIATESTYNSSTNKIATMSDVNPFSVINGTDVVLMDPNDEDYNADYPYRITSTSLTNTILAHKPILDLYNHSNNTSNYFNFLKVYFGNIVYEMVDPQVNGVWIVTTDTTATHCAIDIIEFGYMSRIGWNYDSTNYFGTWNNDMGHYSASISAIDVVNKGLPSFSLSDNKKILSINSGGSLEWILPANPMIFKGGATITKSGNTYTISVTTPSSSSNIKEGYTYKITSAPSNDENFKIGDSLIAEQDNPGTNPQSHWTLIPSGDEPSGTVTSVGLTVPTGLSVSGSPVTSSGTLAITYASGYSIPTTANQTSWTNHLSNTSNPHSVTKSQVGLGSVVNTGDSATPTSGGTTKFTTGGAYTMKTELEAKIPKIRRFI